MLIWRLLFIQAISCACLQDCFKCFFSKQRFEPVAEKVTDYHWDQVTSRNPTVSQSYRPSFRRQYDAKIIITVDCEGMDLDPENLPSAVKSQIRKAELRAKLEVSRMVKLHAKNPKLFARLYPNAVIEMEQLLRIDEFNEPVEESNESEN